MRSSAAFRWRAERGSSFRADAKAAGDMGEVVEDIFRTWRGRYEGLLCRYSFFSGFVAFVVYMALKVSGRLY